MATLASMVHASYLGDEQAARQQRLPNYLSTLYMFHGVPNFVKYRHTHSYLPDASILYIDLETWQNEAVPHTVLCLRRVYYTDQARKSVTRSSLPELDCWQLVDNADNILCSVRLYAPYVVRLMWNTAPAETRDLYSNSDVVHELFQMWTKRHPINGWERHVLGPAAELRAPNGPQLPK